MPLPNIPTGGGFKGMPPSKPPERPQPPPKPTTLFEKTRFVPPKTLLDALDKDKDLFRKTAGGSPSEAKKIRDELGKLLPKGGSITEDWARNLAKRLDQSKQFPATAPKDIPRGPKLKQIREILKKHLGV